MQFQTVPLIKKIYKRIFYMNYERQQDNWKFRLVNGLFECEKSSEKVSWGQVTDKPEIATTPIPQIKRGYGKFIILLLIGIPVAVLLTLLPGGVETLQSLLAVWELLILYFSKVAS